MIYGRNVFNNRLKKIKKRYNNFLEITDDYRVECTTGCLLDHTYIYTKIWCYIF